jgi:hypothetical protein
MPDLDIPFAAIQADIDTATMSMLADAVATVVLPADAAGERFRGMFDAAYQVADLGGIGVSAVAPAFTVLAADMPQAVADALEADGVDVAIEVKGCTYVVVEAMPDAGMTVLRLRKER